MSRICPLSLSLSRCCHTFHGGQTPQYLYCIAELCGREGNKLLRLDLAGQQEEEKEEGMQRFFTVNDDGLGAVTSCAVQGDHLQW